MIAVERRETALWLDEIQIEPKHQRRGIGARLIQDLIKRARAQSIPLHLKVLLENPQARALYERLGFETIDETDTHYVLATRP